MLFHEFDNSEQGTNQAAGIAKVDCYFRFVETVTYSYICINNFTQIYMLNKVY